MEIMSLENKIFYEANELVHQLPNKARTREVRSFIEKDFPQLARTDTVEIGERREMYRMSNPGESCISVVYNRRKRQVDINQGSRFNWEEHNNCLMSPNGRL